MMKILIVDDTLAKIRKLIDAFVEDGIPRGQISIVSTAMNAREQLREISFDLLVLDLLLPLREEDDPTVETSLELLKDVSERDDYKKPKRIVGFTAFEDIAQIANPIFTEMLWVVVLYREDSTEWRAAFKNTTKYLLHQESEALDDIAYETDLCVVTALPSPEMDAVHRLDWNWADPFPVDDVTFVRRGCVKAGNEQVSVVSASAPRMGSVAAALLTAKLISRFRPRFVAMTGICAGVKGKTHLGDAVLFDPTWEWPSGKLVADAGTSYLEPAPHQLPTSEFVTSRFGELSRDSTLLANIRAGWPNPPPTSLRVLTGPGASGSAVVAHRLKVEEIQAQHRKLTALDMEAYGVHAAVRVAALPRPTALVLKSVCDFADEKKSDKWQTYAAYTSASILAAFVQRYFAETRKLAGT